MFIYSLRASTLKFFAVVCVFDDAHDLTEYLVWTADEGKSV
jgi:hypothetical protein